MFYFSALTYELLSLEVKLHYTLPEEHTSEQTFEIEQREDSLLFWCSALCDNDDTITISRWMMLTFNGGIRCGHDFSIDTLISFINNEQRDV